MQVANSLSVTETTFTMLAIRKPYERPGERTRDLRGTKQLLVSARPLIPQAEVLRVLRAEGVPPNGRRGEERTLEAT